MDDSSLSEEAGGGSLEEVGSDPVRLQRRLNVSRRAMWASAVIMVVCMLYMAAGYVVYSQIAASSPCTNHEENAPDAWWAHLYNGSRVQDFDSEPWWFNGTENVSIEVPDEPITLAGWWRAGDPDMPAVVLTHGIRSCKSNHTVLLPSSMLVKANYSVLMIDQRDHGESTIEDGKVSAGQKEWRDMVAAWNWVNETKGVDSARIGVFGTSMGAGAVAIAFTQETAIQAAFVDTTYYDMDRIIDSELRMAGFPTILRPAGVLAGQIASGDNIAEHQPGDAAMSIGDRHLFITHNIPDERIAIVHGIDMCEAANASVTAAGTAGCWFTDARLSEGVEVGPHTHIVSMLVVTEEYEARLVGFFDEAFGVQRAQP